MPKHPPVTSILTSNSGYSLIQMAISLLVLGLLAAGFIQIYTIYKEQQNFLVTQEKVNKAVQQLQIFRQANGYYPCPAPLNVARTDPAYGRATNCADVTQAIGTCRADGLCVQSNTRNIGGVNTTLRVRYGAIPFRRLQMDEQDTFDAYGSRLSYALTENMGVDTTFDELKGGIDIRNEQGESLVEPASSAAFIVLSHGKNRVGAVSGLTGTRAILCPTGAAAANQLDAENCFDPANVAAAATFVNTLRTEGTGPQFDDVVEYFASAENKLWRRNTANPNDITNVTPGNIGIGQFSSMSPPASALTITQTTVDTASGLMKTPNAPNAGYESGALRAGTIMTESICDKMGTKCFYLTDFAFNSSFSNIKLACSSGKYPVGITSAPQANGQIHIAPICRALVSKCPLGKTLTGINTDGSPKCDVAAASCAAKQVSICGQPPQTLPDNAPNGYTQSVSYTVPDAACATATYTCSNGTWIKTADTESHATCNNDPISSQNCATGYRGTYSGFTCGNNNANTQCICEDIPPHTVTTACTSPFSGGSTSRTCSSSCVNNVHQTEVCGPVTGSCTCDLTNTIDFQDCPSGQRRKESPTPSSFSSPATLWPADVKKGAYRKLTIDTNSCKYDAPEFDTSNCECDPTPEYKTVLKNPSDYPTVNPDYVVHEYCYEPKTGSRKVMDGSDVAIENLDYAYAVMKTPKDPHTCTAITGSTTELAPAQFQAKPYRWLSSRAPLQTNMPDHAKAAKELNSACDCQTYANTIGTCYQVVGGNKYDIYACSCR